MHVTSEWDRRNKLVFSWVMKTDFSRTTDEACSSSRKRALKFYRKGWILKCEIILPFLMSNKPLSCFRQEYVFKSLYTIKRSIFHSWCQCRHNNFLDECWVWCRMSEIKEKIIKNVDILQILSKLFFFPWGIFICTDLHGQMVTLRKELQRFGLFSK